jgi:transmembrane sensor
LGEQKMVELADHSHLVLNARTKLKVRFSTDIRSIELLEGQAQFSVAKDPARPFKVHAGSKTVVAVGTVFDVQLIDNEFEVSMLEGRVAVLSATEVNSLSAAAIPLELSTGEALYVHADGEAAVVKADIEAATAWRQGKVIFRDEPMSEAVHRLNRYSRQQVVIDDVQLGRLKVSGVFDSDDTQAFAEAMQSYLPVTADLSRRSVIHLRLK